LLVNLSLVTRHCFYPIAVTRRLRYHKKSDVLRAAVEYLMRNRGSDFNSLLVAKRRHLIRDSNRQLPFKDEKELTRQFVVVPHFACCRRHALQDHAELSRPDQVPAVAWILLAAPGVVGGVGVTDWAVGWFSGTYHQTN
jgi:hypothetical protein